MNAYEALQQNLDPLTVDLINRLVEGGLLYVGDTTEETPRAIFSSPDSEMLINSEGLIEVRLDDGDFVTELKINLTCEEDVESNSKGLLFVAGLR